MPSSAETILHNYYALVTCTYLKWIHKTSVTCIQETVIFQLLFIVSLLDQTCHFTCICITYSLYLFALVNIEISKTGACILVKKTVWNLSYVAYISGMPKLNIKSFIVILLWFMILQVRNLISCKSQVLLTFPCSLCQPVEGSTTDAPATDHDVGVGPPLPVRHALKYLCFVRSIFLGQYLGLHVGTVACYDK